MNSVQPGNKRISGGNPALRLIPDPSGWLVPEETSDAAVSCYYEILKQKRTKRSGYFPGVDSSVRPVCLSSLISSDEWEQKIEAFNNILMKWWVPGDKLRNASYVAGTVCLMFPCLVAYCAMDEVGYFCFVNRKREQALRVLAPVCEKLSDSRLRWSVNWRSLRNPQSPSSVLTGIELKIDVINNYTTLNGVRSVAPMELELSAGNSTSELLHLVPPSAAESDLNMLSALKSTRQVSPDGVSERRSPELSSAGIGRGGGGTKLKTAVMPMSEQMAQEKSEKNTEEERFFRDELPPSRPDSAESQFSGLVPS